MRSRGKKRQFPGRRTGAAIAVMAAGWVFWGGSGAQAVDGEPGAPPVSGAEAPPGEAGAEEAAVESIIPSAHGLYRYEPIWSNSPFMLETPLTTMVTETFAKDLAVTSVYTYDGVTRVGLVNVKTREPQPAATTKEPNANGIRVLKVVENPDPSKVEIELEGANAEKAQVAFDTMIIQGKPSVPKPPAAAALRAPGAAPQAGQPGGFAAAIQNARKTAPTRRRIVLPKSITTPTNKPATPPPAFLQQGNKPAAPPAALLQQGNTGGAPPPAFLQQQGGGAAPSQ